MSSNPKGASTSSTTASEDLNGSEGAEEDDIQDSIYNDGPTPTSSLAVNIPSSNYFNHHHSNQTSVSTPTPNNLYSSSPSWNSSSRNSKSTDSSTVSVPASPSIADSELDSPSSLGSMSSFNSYIGKRSGDLADVEDLDLDDYGSNYHNNHEPELETVSEIDEEESSSSFCSGSGSVSDDQRTGVAASILDSDLEEKESNGSSNGSNHHHHDLHGSRRRLGGLGAIQNHHTGTASGLAHFHLSHFSPRHGGHGLSSSHARIHSGRLNKRTQQAQHQKGRIAELLEEGGGEGIPSEPLTKGSPSSPTEESDRRLDNPRLVEEVASSIHAANFDREQPDWGQEFPPPLPHPQRSISPSDTIPANPSPLSECLSVGETNNDQDSNSNPNSSSPVVTALEESLETLRDPSPSSTFKGLSHSTSNSDLTPTNSLIRKTKNERNRDPSSTSTSSIKANDDGTSSPGSTPPSSPVLVRNISRGRRASSPTRSRPKQPLRPCFKRRTPAQSYHGSTSHARDSSSERECSSGPSIISSRGRGHVRFSNAPPQEARTHSPVDYDRKSCPISNRLSLDDVEELRNLKMEMNLLEAKWKSMSACEKHQDCEDPKERIECRDCENPDDSIFRKVRKEKALLFRDSCGNTDAPRINDDNGDGRIDVGYCKTGYSSDSTSTNYSRNNSNSSSSSYLSPPSLYRRGSADSTPTLKSLSSSTMNSSSSFKDNDLTSSDDIRISAAQHLRLERERERERERKNLLKFSHNKSSPISKNKNMVNNSSIIARFGLTTPPPPLPGTGSSSNSPQSSRSISREASKENLRETSRTDLIRPTPKSLNTNITEKSNNSTLLSPRSSSAPPTSRTPSEERIFRLSNARQSINDAESIKRSSTPTFDDGKKEDEEEEEDLTRGRSNSISPSLGSSNGGNEEDDEDDGEEEEEEDRASNQIHLNRDYNFTNGIGNGTNSRRDPSTDTIVANSPTRGRSNFSRNSSNTTPSVTVTAPTSSNQNSSKANKQQIEESEAESDYGGPSSSNKSNPYKSNFTVGSSWKPNGIQDGYKSWNSTPTTTPVTSSFPTGYDSPASEFYESGSEYDLIG